MSLCKLPSTTVKLLSSAQVITSVSSVVKELIENSLDAGATNIEVKLENHGLDKIEVRDNGDGVKKDDVWNMCKKSFTSKIRNFEDLEKLESFGFRGEALNSLCALAKVSITTINESDSIAMTYEFDNVGNVVGSRMTHGTKGTTVVVEQLFKNLPVRKQYLSNGKRKSEEIKKVEMTVKSLAVIHPKVRLVLTHNKFVIWQKNSAPSIRLSLVQAVAPTIVKQLVDLRQTCDKVNLQLLVPAKGCNISSTCYGNSGEALFLFINNRPVRDKAIEKVVQDEILNYFGTEIPSGKCPTCLVSITLPAHSLDVNLEPNKTRVIIKDMPEIINILRSVLINYYIGPLNAPKDFLETIDAEVEKNCDKRKPEDNTQIDSERIKIPRLSPDKNVNLTQIDNLPSCKKSVNPVKKLSPEIKTSTDSVGLVERREEREAVVAEFMEGVLEDKSLSKPSEESGYETSITNTSLNEKRYFEDNLENDLPDESGNEVEVEETKCTDLDNITLSQWSRGTVKLGGSIVKNVVDIFGVNENPISESNLLNEKSRNKSIKNNEEASRENQSTDDSITLSQWSRGNVKIGGNIVQSSTVLRENEKDRRETESLSIVNIDSLSNSEMRQEETELNFSDLSKEIECNDVEGFNKFTIQMSQKIAEESKGVSFSKVASDVANKWRQLQGVERDWSSEKNKPKERPLKIIKEDKEKASMRDRLKKFLEKSKENKTLKKRHFWKTKEIDLQMGLLKKALERRVTKQASDKELQYIGAISEDLKCAIVEGNELYLFSSRRLAESLLFHKNLASMIVPVKVLETNIPVNSKNLGESLWAVLISMETALDVGTGSIIISDRRITSNGLRIQLVKEPDGGCHFDITDVPLHIAFFGLNDLKEILNLLELSSLDVPLEDCRPLKIISYIRAETIRSISKNTLDTSEENVAENFKYWFSKIKPKEKSCPHHNPIYKKMNFKEVSNW